MTDFDPPIFLLDNQEYTNEGYLITYDQNGEIETIVNWQDTMARVESTDTNYIPLVDHSRK